MDGTGLHLEVATDAHAAAIADVYRHYVEETAVSFEETAPDSAAVAERIVSTVETHPWFVAISDERVVGFASAGEFRSRPAYRWVVELSIYVAPERRGEGIGSLLYGSLIKTLTRQGYASAYAAIALPNAESVDFHEAFGFEHVGTLPAVGQKFGEWHDVGYYERPLADREVDPAEPTPFDECRASAWLDRILTSDSETHDR